MGLDQVTDKCFRMPYLIDNRRNLLFIISSDSKMSKNTGSIPVSAGHSKISELMSTTPSRSFFDHRLNRTQNKKNKKDKKEKNIIKDKKNKNEKKKYKRSKLVPPQSSSQPEASLLSSSSSLQTHSNGFSASQPQPTLNHRLQEQRASASKQQQSPKQGLSTRPQTMDFRRPNAVGIAASSSTASLTASETAQMPKILASKVDNLDKNYKSVD
ncbi:hypothetical protein TSAR_004306 [Trichomalopsis sarcophagae]|uniref:Uncharacterized protein n=1 Tax=Trichomalopsis sarcophagae TaxID=543379 RepID=A0A232F6T1_9HYME|nr:hypothetical protein TSAR_004306 [Trichomalopsis sarcophagae]